MRNKLTFKTVDKDDREVELVVIRPSPKQNVDAQLVFNREWRKAEDGGSLLRSQLDDLNDKHSLWGPDQRKKVADIETEMINLERKLRGGSTHFNSVTEAKEVAMKIRTLRAQRMNLLRGRIALDNYTAESFAEAARLQYLVSVATFDAETGRIPYFKGYDDFIARSEEKAALDSFSNYIELTMGDDSSPDNYEDTWLKKYNFSNEKGYLTNARGQMVDSEGKLINEKFQFVTEDGQTCDREGNLVDDDGNYLVEYKEFGGNEVVVDSELDNDGV